ncbi:MAG: thioredoxin family protein [Proteobacteria bacterium]|nr:thioredoxin family protein [Pseudomonadota bacterium]
MIRGLVFIFLTMAFQPVFGCSTRTLSGTDLRTGHGVSVNPKEGAKGTVVLFLSAVCPCSKSHEKGLEALAQEFSQFKFVGVHSNADENGELARRHFQKAGFSFPVIQDENSKIADDFRALKTPHAFIIGPQGECWFNGGVDNSNDSTQATEHYLRAALLDLQNGKEPKEKQVRTLGCVIRRQ